MISRAQSIGKRGEEVACVFLARRGFRIIDRNWRVRGGEIDIVAVDLCTSDIVFVEVKTRTSDTYGLPESSIGPIQQRGIERAIASYVFEKEVTRCYRFDVIIITKKKIRHLKNVSLC